VLNALTPPTSISVNPPLGSSPLVGLLSAVQRFGVEGRVALAEAAMPRVVRPGTAVIQHQHRPPRAPAESRGGLIPKSRRLPDVEVQPPTGEEVGVGGQRCRTAAPRAGEDLPERGRVADVDSRATVSTASDARPKLIQTCPNAAPKAELAGLTERLNEWRSQAAAWPDRGELVKQTKRQEETADRSIVRRVPFAPTARIDRFRAQAARQRRLGQQALATLAALSKEIAKAEQEQNAVYERMTAP